MAGRPLKFKSPIELQHLIDAYFESCWEIGEDGKKKNIRPYTVTGLALALDTSRETLLDYQSGKYDIDYPEGTDEAQKKQFSDTIKRAKEMCENYTEEYLYTGKNTAGAIFNMVNNYGWENKRNTDLTTKGDKINFEKAQEIDKALNDL